MISHLFFFSVVSSPSPPTLLSYSPKLFSFLLPGSVQGPPASLWRFCQTEHLPLKYWSELLLYQADSANTCLLKELGKQSQVKKALVMENWLSVCNPWQLGISISWLFCIYQLQLKSTFFNWQIPEESVSAPGLPQGKKWGAGMISVLSTLQFCWKKSCKE